MPILRGDYNNLDVPEDILNKVVLDDLLFVDVLNAGPRTGTGLDETSTTQRGEVKNHWRWRALIPGNGGEDGQIVFGFNLKQAPSVASDAAQYAGRSSIGAGSNLGSDHTHSQSDSEEAAFSDVSSLGKPPVVESDNRSRFESQGSTEGQGNVEGGRTSFNDDEARNIAPSIRSSDGNEIAQPVKEGAPVPGCLEIQVRTHTARSVKAIFSCSFRLKAKTTFRELFDAVVSRGMLPFHFRKLDAAYFGCRDGISQAAAAWLEDGLMLKPECIEEPQEHIYKLLCFRYTIASSPVPGDGEQDYQRTENWIDRGLWSEGFMHVEDIRLKYNQPAEA